jgi:thiamine pyrophosphate-dependent acetolactate synthase large subunit-like protein
VASPIGGRVLSEADCLIVFGASLNHDTTAGGAFTNGKRIVQVDSRADSIGRRTRVASGVVGDAGRVAETMVTWLDRLGPPSANWCRHLAGELAAHEPGDGIVDYGTDDTVDARLFTIRLNKLLPEERTVVTDAGRFMIAPLAWLSVPEPDAFILPCAFGAIGLGLGVGIGAAFATPGRPVVVTAGDGGAMMSMLELATTVRHGLNLIYVIYNNRAYGAEIRATEAEGLDPMLALIEWPELLPLAKSLGCAGVRVAQPADLEHLADAIAGEARPLVVDVMLDPFAPAGP